MFGFKFNSLQYSMFMFYSCGFPFTVRISTLEVSLGTRLFIQLQGSAPREKGKAYYIWFETVTFFNVRERMCMF